MEALETRPHSVEDVEEQWLAWNERCRVSHHHHFIPARNTGEIAFHEVDKPLADLRVALGTSGGLYVRGMEPFDMTSTAGDDTLRWIPADVETGRLRFAHDHYDHNEADDDPNCIFPIDRLREFADEGIIGSLAGQHFGFMGWIPNPDRFIRETIPDLVEQLLSDKVDAVVLSPG